MPAAPRLRERTTKFPAWLHQHERLALDNRNIGIVAQLTKRASFRKRRIKQRHALDATPCDPKIT
jgi:hypothetical protein